MTRGVVKARGGRSVGQCFFRSNSVGVSLCFFARRLALGHVRLLFVASRLGQVEHARPSCLRQVEHARRDQVHTPRHVTLQSPSFTHTRSLSRARTSSTLDLLPVPILVCPLPAPRPDKVMQET